MCIGNSVCQLQTSLKDVSHVSLSFDLWTSLAMDSYLACVAHFIDDAFEMRELFIGFDKLSGLTSRE